MNNISLGAPSDLDLAIFALTADEDGIISSDDFQASAVSVGSFARGSYPGGTVLTLDVTSFAQADVSGGSNFSGYRVELLGTDSTDGGRQFLNLFNNGSGDTTRPQLIVTVPEPASVALAGLGAGLLGLRRRK